MSEHERLPTHAPAVTPFDDPGRLAAAVADCPRPLLVGLDVDGVLAPIVDHPDQAVLLDGMADAVRAAMELSDVHVVVLSGRTVADLARFGFDTDVEVVGSHGLERRDQPLAALDDDESALFALADGLASEAAALAGDGAFVERKPASVVLHVRTADRAGGAAAIAWLAERVATIAGLSAKPGSDVLELFARAGDKGTALAAARDRLGAATTVYVGDDVTDEDAFAVLAPTDLGIKVGPAPTIARARLATPTDVRTWLVDLARRCAQNSVD